MRDLMRRVSRLEKAMIPPAPWRITAQFADGHTEIMTAREYRKAKEVYLHDIHVVDRTISGNLDELDDWLQMVRFVASMAVYEDNGPYIPDDINEVENWLATASQTAVTAI